MIENSIVEKISPPVKRIIGEYPSNDLKGGPVLLISAGIHGNEPSGVLALQRVFKKLDEKKPPIAGGILGVSGNLAAINEGVRMIDKDLNRICSLENEKKIRKQGVSEIHEDIEFRDLFKIVEQIGLNENFEQILFMDLHTTSSDSYPYISVNKKASRFEFAKKFPLPVVCGIEKYIPGHFDHYLTLKGNKGFTVEAGQHYAKKSIDHHESMIWMALEIGGLIAKDSIPEYEKHLNRLEKAAVKDGYYEVYYRYQIRPDEKFIMEQGFANFSKISKGELLACSDEKPIYSEWDDYIFLPLYQSQGNDGFFIVKAIE